MGFHLYSPCHVHHVIHKLWRGFSAVPSYQSKPVVYKIRGELIWEMVSDFAGSSVLGWTHVPKNHVVPGISQWILWIFSAWIGSTLNSLCNSRLLGHKCLYFVFNVVYWCLAYLLWNTTHDISLEKWIQGKHCFISC